MQTEVNLAKVRMANAGSPSFPWLSQTQPFTDVNICVAGMMAQSGKSLQYQGKKTDMVVDAPKYSMGV